MKTDNPGGLRKYNKRKDHWNWTQSNYEGRVGTPPCDDCSWKDTCFEHELACDAYAKYVGAGFKYQDLDDRTPCRKTFNQIYRDYDPPNHSPW